MTPDFTGYHAATIGTFDGVHRGHQEVLAILRDSARIGHMKPVVVTFDRHPLSVIAPERAPKEIYTPARKKQLLKESGMEVLMMKFSQEMMHLSAAEWLTLLRERYNVRLVVLGYDNTFGSDGRAMTTDDYIRLGAALGIEVIVAPEIPGCSSSLARRALADGDVAEAAHILSRPYLLEGTVVSGDRIGRTLGFPTANLDTAAFRGLQLPANGVYLSRVSLGNGEAHTGITNIGVRPSVSRIPELRIETHLLDFDGELYGERISLMFLSRLREEKKFSSLEMLKDAIARDEAAARALSDRHAIPTVKPNTI